MSGDPKIAAVFAAVCELAIASGAESIKDLPGCWNATVDEHWRVALNGHDADRPAWEGGPDVPPYCAFVEFNGWPAGMLSAHGGAIAAGEIANEDALLAALRRAIRSSGGEVAQ